MQNILEIRDLGRSYVNFRLEHISLSIPGGTIMGLVGENGAGKSTTIRAALGLIRKDAGEVLYCGEPLTTDSAAMKEQIGVVFDSICFYPELTVEKAGKICRKTYRNWDEAYFRELLEQFSLEKTLVANAQLWEGCYSILLFMSIKHISFLSQDAQMV